MLLGWQQARRQHPANGVDAVFRSVNYRKRHRIKARIVQALYCYVYIAAFRASVFCLIVMGL